MILYICLALLGFLYWYFKIREPGWAREFKGPSGLPIFGNMFQVDPLHPHVTYQKWAKEFGDVIKVTMFGEIHLIANDYESIYEILVKKSNEFAGRPDIYRANAVTLGNKNIIMQDFCPRLLLMKKLCMIGMRVGQGGDQDIEQAALECSTELIDQLREAKGQAVDIRADLRAALLKVILTLGYGVKLSSDDSIFLRLANLERTVVRATCFDGQGLLLDVFPWLRIFGGSIVADINECADIQKTDLVELLKKTQKQRTEGNTDRCILDPALLNNAEETNSDSVIDDIGLLGMAQDLIVAGLTTTSTLLYLLINLLLHYPEVQRKAQQEIDEVVTSDDPVMLEDRPKMPYCQAVIFEILRYSSNVPLSVAHKTTQDTTLAGRFVPKGVMVMTNLWAVHHDERFWKEPYKFIPERFLDDDGQLRGPDDPVRRRMLAFGAGRRICAGETLALFRVFIFFTNMLKNFTFTPQEGVPLVSCDPRSKVFGLGSVTNPPDFKVRPIPR